MPTAGEPVAPPDDWDRIMSYDLSPQRPDAFAATTAWRWRDAVQCRNAWEHGREDAMSEQVTFAHLDQDQP